MAALAAALAGTLVWRVTVLSIGYPAVGVLVFGVVYGTAGRRPARGEWAGIAMTLALLAVPAVLAAEWLGALCIMAAWIVGWCTLAGGRTFTAVFAGPFVAWVLPARVVGWTQRALRRITLPGGRGDTRRLLVVVAVTVVLIAAFAGLFASADVAFAHVLSGLVPQLDVGEVVARSVVFAIVAAFVLFGAYLVRFPPRLDAAAPRVGWTVARWEWAMPLAALDVLFVAFVAVQATVLFGGHRHVLETAGLTYAEYARQGFWQLLVVSALTMLVIAATLQLADTARDRLLVRILVGLLCLMSVVVVVSAVHRMWLYQQAYGFSQERLLVITVELWLGVVFGLIALCGIRMSAGWLPRAVLTAGVAALLGLAAVNPDRLIVQHNIDRYHHTGHIDAAYLTGLSTDALPPVQQLPESDPMRQCLRAWVTNVHSEPWYEFNLSRWRAARSVAADPAPDRTTYRRDCGSR